MKGFVPTPPLLVDKMVAKLFRSRPPREGDSLLDPGCGTGAFVEGVLRWCETHGCPVPRIVGVDSDQSLLDEARRRIGSVKQVALINQDFLAEWTDRFDYIIAIRRMFQLRG